MNSHNQGLHGIAAKSAAPREACSQARDMAAEQELLAIAKAIEDISGGFVKSRSLGLHLRSIDKAEFKRLTVESKSIMDAELGRANDFSMNLIHSINTGSGGFLGGPSLARM